MSDKGDSALPSPERVAAANATALQLLAGLDSAILGQPDINRLVVIACLAQGHILLEGLPGLGKTELVKSLAHLLGLDFRRLQFTPDLLPGDVTGGPILEETAAGRRFVFHPGPVFTNVLLADEINRASPKTQSALLEAMQERRVTVLGETRDLPLPFCVLATQNPIELEGTYPLPEAQLDRFLFKIDIPGATQKTLESILTTRRRGKVPDLTRVADVTRLSETLATVEAVHLPTAVANYIARIVVATHPNTPSAPAVVKSYVKFGASPRAAIAIAESARASALLRGKPNVGFEDVLTVTAPTLVHRLVLDVRARLDNVRPADVVRAVLAAVQDVDSHQDPAVPAVPRGAKA